jgi:hypothetical protein
MGEVWQKTARIIHQKSENVLEKVSGRKRQDRLMLKNSEGKEVAEHCKLYFERLLNERLIGNDATESPREGGSEENKDATIPTTRAEILREIGCLVKVVLLRDF